MRQQIPTTHTNLDLTNINHAPSCGTHSCSNALLYVFEDNEAVIKMIIKGRSHPMRHVSRTHRAALDWLCDRINLDPMIQIKYVDTKHRFADTDKGKLHTQWVDQSSSFVQHQPLQLYFAALRIPAWWAASKRWQKGCRNRREKKEVWQNRNLQHVPTCSSSAKSPIASKRPGILTVTGKLGSRMRRNSKSDAASSSQVRLQDAYLGGLMDTATGKLVATKEESGDVDLSESETWSFQEEAVTERPTADKLATEKSNASSKSVDPGSPKAERKEWSHNLRVSPATVHHVEALLSIVRKIYGREHDDPKDDLDEYGYLGHFKRRLFEQQFILDTTVRWIHLWDSVGQLFNENEKLISEQTEITGAYTINFKKLTFMSTSLLCSRANRINAKTYVFSDSGAPCGKNGRCSYCNLEEQNQMVFGKQSLQGYESNRRYADGVREENIPRNHSVGPSREDSKINDRTAVWTRAFKGRIIFMSMYNDIVWQAKWNKEQCEYNSQTVAEYARKFPRGHWSLLEPGSEKKWCGSYTDKPDGSWDQIAENVMTNFSDSGHPIFRASSAFEQQKSMARSLFTSTVALKPSSCFSARWFLRISSVSTEQ